MKVLKIPPEMTDGQHWTVMKLSELAADTTIRDSLRDFVAWGSAGDSIEFKIAEMTEEEIDALPDI